MEGKVLRTGFVWAGGYASKTRRIGFAIAKSEDVSTEVVMAEVARLNQFVYDWLRKNNIEKSDVLRIEVPYSTDPFKFDLDKMKIDVFRRIGGVGQ